MDALDDDALRSVADALLSDPLLGILGLASLQRCARRLHRLFFAYAVEAEPGYAEFVWRIADFRGIAAERLYSPWFSTKYGQKFRLLVFPRGNEVDEHLSLYLDVPDARHLPDGWHRKVTFALHVHNQVDGSKDVGRFGVTNTYGSRCVDWGFRELLLLSDLHSEPGWLVDDVLCVSVTLEVATPKVTFPLLKRVKDVRTERWNALRAAVPKMAQDLRFALLFLDAVPRSSWMLCRACEAPLTRIVLPASGRTRTERECGATVCCQTVGCRASEGIVEAHARLRAAISSSCPNEYDDEEDERHWPKPLRPLCPEDFLEPCLVAARQDLHARALARNEPDAYQTWSRCLKAQCR